jgi:hypothetical protein
MRQDKRLEAGDQSKLCRVADAPTGRICAHRQVQADARQHPRGVYDRQRRVCARLGPAHPGVRPTDRLADPILAEAGPQTRLVELAYDAVERLTPAPGSSIGRSFSTAHRPILTGRAYVAVNSGSLEHHPRVLRQVTW